MAKLDPDLLAGRSAVASLQCDVCVRVFLTHDSVQAEVTVKREQEDVPTLMFTFRRPLTELDDRGVAFAATCLSGVVQKLDRGGWPGLD